MIVTLEEEEWGVGESLGENVRHGGPEHSGHTGGRGNRRGYGLVVRYEERDDSSVTQS